MSSVKFICKNEYWNIVIDNELIAEILLFSDSIRFSEQVSLHKNAVAAMIYGVNKIFENKNNKTDFYVMYSE